MANAPLLRQSVRWGEEYVSRALNLKFAGIIPAGIYRGFHVEAGPGSAVTVDHGDSPGPSIAVVERDGYSLTVIMDDGGIVEIPAAGEWLICLEVFYAPTQPGYQRIVAREKAEPHHVILGKVILDEAGVRLIQKDRLNANLVVESKLSEAQVRESANSISQSANLMRVANRVLKLELERNEIKKTLQNILDENMSLIERRIEDAHINSIALGACIMRLSNNTIELLSQSEGEKNV